MAVEQVVGNDELLTAILACLPPKSIFRFMCVSRRWNNIFSDRYFLEYYSVVSSKKQFRCNGDGRLLAFIQKKDKLAYFSPTTYGQNPINILPIAQIRDNNIKQVPSRFGEFIHSSSGLILCSTRESSEKKYYVVNPITGKFVSLPPPSIYTRMAISGLVCEENAQELAPNFRIVCTFVTGSMPPESGESTLEIETYFSKTGIWEKSTLVGRGEFKVVYRSPVVLNGLFHWYSKPRTLVIYNSNGNENRVYLIKLPGPTNDSAITRSSSDDVLWFGLIDFKSVKFYMLPKDENGSYMRSTTISENEWILMYTISFDYLHMSIESKKRKRGVITKNKPSGFFKLEALIPCNKNVVAVLSLGEKVCLLYNLERKTIELVQYCGHPSPEHWWSGLFPYMEPLFLSSYALSTNVYY